MKKLSSLFIAFILGFTLFASPAFAAIAQVTGAHAVAFQGATTASANFTGVNLIVVSQVSYTGAPATTLSDSLGNTYLPLTKQTSTGISATQLFYAVNPTVSSSMTFTGQNSGCDIHVQGFSGVATSPFDQQNGNAVLTGGGTSQQPGSITPTVNNELLIVGEGGYSSAGIPSNGDVNYTTIDANGSGGAGVSFQGGLWYSIQTTAAASNPTISWTGTNGDSEVAIASFKATAAGPATFGPATFTIGHDGGLFINNGGGLFIGQL